MGLQIAAPQRRGDLISDADLRRQSQEFLTAFGQAVASGDDDIDAPPWDPVRDLLAEISLTRARLGFTPSEPAPFVFSLKQPLFRVSAEVNRAGDGAILLEQFWTITILLDKLGLLTTESYQKTREEIIGRQQRELLELSTPVVK